MIPTYEKLTLATCEIARRAGHFMANELKNFDDKKIESKGLHDLVSYVDKESEKQIISELQQLLPESGFIAEEGTNSKRGKQFNWVIDPLDGTTNYLHCIPVYSVSIALLDGDELVLGVVYEVGHDECFYAWKNGGAYLNAEAIKVSNRDEIQNSLLATGFPYNNFDKMEGYMKTLNWAMKNARGVRRLGSAAADLAYVACGRFDAFWENNLKSWDVAAGIVLVKEAGGKVTDATGGDNYLFGGEIVATNNWLDQIVLNQIKNNNNFSSENIF